MKMKHSSRPALEGLEARWVPATIRLVGGNLYVSNQVGTLTVSTTGTAGQVTVNDFFNATNHKVTVNGVGGLIGITGTNKLNSITFDSSALAFPGNLLINALNGNDALTLTGTVGGNMTVLGGYGDDTQTVTGVSKVGGTLTFNGGPGANDIILGDDLTVGANLNATSLNAISGDGDLTVGGSAALVANLAASVPIEVTLAGAIRVGGSLTVVGGGADDVVQLGDTGLLDVGGNFTMNLGGGDNTVDLLPGAGTVGGNLGVNTGAGDDLVTVGSNMEIDGSALVNLGEGANDFDTLAGSSVFGNLWLSVGNGDNLAMSLAGSVGGTLALFQGNGANGRVTVSTVPARLLYRGGNGGAATTDNVIELAGAGTYLVDMVYGTGFGGLDLTGGATETLTGIVVGTGGTYTFNQNAAILAPELVFINFP